MGALIKNIAILAILAQAATAFSQVSDDKNKLIVKNINVAIKSLKK